MQELKVCLYEAPGGARVGSVVDDRVYDLNLCCAGQLASEKGSSDSYRLANNIVPRDLGDFIRGGDAVLAAARSARSWALQTDADEGPAGETLHHSAGEVKLKDWTACTHDPAVLATPPECFRESYLVPIQGTWEQVIP